MDFETLLYDVEDGVATITFNRPEKHNAFNFAMAAELKQVWQIVQTDPDVVCAIVTGRGDRAFCTGMDVADVASGESRGSGLAARGQAVDATAGWNSHGATGCASSPAWPRSVAVPSGAWEGAGRV